MEEHKGLHTGFDPKNPNHPAFHIHIWVLTGDVDLWCGFEKHFLEFMFHALGRRVCLEVSFVGGRLIGDCNWSRSCCNG